MPLNLLGHRRSEIISNEVVGVDTSFDSGDFVGPFVCSYVPV